MNTRSIDLPGHPGLSRTHGADIARGPHRSVVAALRNGARRLGSAVAAWQQRAHDRALLRTLTERELCDLGLSRGDVLVEADKPFWRL